jgi:hypothetical protein
MLPLKHYTMLPLAIMLVFLFFSFSSLYLKPLKNTLGDPPAARPEKAPGLLQILANRRQYFRCCQACSGLRSAPNTANSRRVWPPAILHILVAVKTV